MNYLFTLTRYIIAIVVAGVNGLFFTLVFPLEIIAFVVSIPIVAITHTRAEFHKSELANFPNSLRTLMYNHQQIWQWVHSDFDDDHTLVSFFGGRK